MPSMGRRIDPAPVGSQLHELPSSKPLVRFSLWGPFPPIPLLGELIEFPPWLRLPREFLCVYFYTRIFLHVYIRY